MLRANMYVDHAGPIFNWLRSCHHTTSWSSVHFVGVQLLTSINLSSVRIFRSQMRILRAKTKEGWIIKYSIWSHMPSLGGAFIEGRNKTLIRSFIEEIFNERNLSSIEKYFGKESVEGSPQTGRGGRGTIYENFMGPHQIRRCLQDWKWENHGTLECSRSIKFIETVRHITFLTRKVGIQRCQSSLNFGFGRIWG